MNSEYVHMNIRFHLEETKETGPVVMLCETKLFVSSIYMHMRSYVYGYIYKFTLLKLNFLFLSIRF